MFKIYRRFDNQQGYNSNVQRPVPPASRIQQKHQSNLPALPMPSHHAQQQKKPEVPRKQTFDMHNQQTGQHAAFQNMQSQQYNQRQTHQNAQSAQGQCSANKQKTVSSKKRTIPTKNSVLQSFLPSALYDPNNKKLFGFLKSEDLLLIALIFLLLEKDGDDNFLMVLALCYVLISDYIELPELGF